MGQLKLLQNILMQNKIFHYQLTLLKRYAPSYFLGITVLIPSCTFCLHFKIFEIKVCVNNILQEN